jgi:hypothetical protein
MGRILIAVSLVLLAAGCGNGDAKGGAGKGPGGSLTYVVANDSSVQNRIAGTVWRQLLSAPCWTLQGSTNNYSFSQPSQYRYAGTSDTYAGNVSIQSAGTYGDKNAAQLVLRDDVQIIVLLSATEFALAFEYNGSWVINTFVASNTCV